jgi:hypothetical protein
VRSITSQLRGLTSAQNLPSIRHLIADLQWSKYAPDYPLERRLADFAMAQKQNKHLLELNMGNYTDTVENPSDFLLKTVGKLTYYPTFQIPGLSAITFQRTEALDTVIKADPTSKEAEFELIAPLDQCLACKSTLLACKPLKKVKYILGIIPLDKRLLKLMFMIFVPVIVHDVLYSTSFMNILSQWFGTVAYPLLAAILYNGNNTMTRSYYPNNQFKKLNVVTVIVSTIGFAIFYPYSADHFGFIAIVIATFYYGFVLWDHFLETNVDRATQRTTLRFKNRELAPLFVLILTLVIFMNDYTMVYKSILDRTLFYRLFWNTIHSVLLTLYCIWNNAVISVLYAGQTEGFKWRYLIGWDSIGVKLVFCWYLAALFVTLYAPYWGYAHAN